ncbi:MAG TPA: hypothetical protein VEK10_10165 [Steroidobacteraceae bacterium]|nr:hypothetical protein [Steroidobacteraceae bacterium]
MSAALAKAKRTVKPRDSLVSAVAAGGKTTALPVQVKFDLKERPDVGQPVEIELVIVPMSGSVERISGKVQADDGLELVDGADIPPSDRPAEGVPIQHTVKVRPQHDGIFTFSAVVTVNAGSQSGTETYSMPLIAGVGLPDAASKPATAASAAPPPSTGQATAQGPAPSTGRAPVTTLATAASPASPTATATGATAH